MIKAIIFDFFGVLVSDGWLPFKNKYFGDDPAMFKKASELNNLSNLRKISNSEFIKQIAHMAGVDEQTLRSYMDRHVVDEKVIDYIKDLKANYKIGLLSNAAGPLDKILSKEQLDIFDATAISYETGFVKPDPSAFKVITERLGVKTDECVFIDDYDRYCAAASSVGMKTIAYQDFPQLKQELEKILPAGSDN